MRFEHLNPAAIEAESMAVIGRELAAMGKLPAPENEAVVKRVIHATADFDFAENLHFSPGAVAELAAFLRGGGQIVCDTNMARAGVNQARLSRLGGQVHCLMAEPQVAEEAAARGLTRAWVAVEHAARTLPGPLLFVVGNAPTALVRIHQLMEEGALRPAGVVGVPVGFVNVVESKELFLQVDIPVILSLGRKGGSTVAAAICNALVILAGGC